MPIAIPKSAMTSMMTPSARPKPLMKRSRRGCSSWILILTLRFARMPVSIEAIAIATEKRTAIWITVLSSIVSMKYEKADSAITITPKIIFSFAEILKRSSIT